MVVVGEVVLVVVVLVGVVVVAMLFVVCWPILQQCHVDGLHR